MFIYEFDFTQRTCFLFLWLTHNINTFLCLYECISFIQHVRLHEYRQRNPTVFTKVKDNLKELNLNPDDFRLSFL